jgi:hypothetical protein
MSRHEMRGAFNHEHDTYATRKPLADLAEEALMQQKQENRKVTGIHPSVPRLPGDLPDSRVDVCSGRYQVHFTVAVSATDHATRGPGGRNSDRPDN